MQITPQLQPNALSGAFRQIGEAAGALAGRRFEADRIDIGRARHPVVEPAPRLEAPDPGALDAKSGFTGKALALVKQALSGLARDVGKAFEAVGLDAEAGKALVKGFVEPLLQAIREGLDVTAQFKLVATESTKLVSNAGIAESLSVFAKSVEISVNHDSGEVAVSVQELSIEQDSVVAFRGGPVAAVAPTASPDLLSFLKEALPPEAPIEGKEALGGLPAPRPFDPPLDFPLAKVDGGGRSDATDQVTRGRILLRAVERLQSEAGEQITRIRLDAQVSITRRHDDGLDQLVPDLPKPGLDLKV